MKVWQMGLVAVGAAVAVGLAVRVAEPPSVPAAASQVSAASAVLAPASAPPPAQALPSPPAPGVRWKTANEPPETVASAPPAVYTEPPHTERPAPQPVKRKPFPEPVRTAKAEPAPAMKAPAPVPYQEPPKPARHVTLEPGMRISVRVSAGDPTAGVLDQPVIADGLEVGERGAKVSVRAEEGGRFRLLSFQSADGQKVEVPTEPEAATGGVLRFRLLKRVTITERKL